MIVNTITEAKTQLSSLIERVQNGEEIIIARAGKPAAILIPWRPRPTARKPGRFKGKIQIAADFDHLPSDIAGAFGIVTDRGDQ